MAQRQCGPRTSNRNPVTTMCRYLQVSASTFTDSTWTIGGRSTFGWLDVSSSAGDAFGCCTGPVTSTFLLTWPVHSACEDQRQRGQPGDEQRLCGGFRRDGQQEAARISDLERPALELGVVRLRSEPDARVSGLHRDLVDVLRRGDEQSHADPLFPIASLLPIVLIQTDLAPAGAHHHAEQLPIVFPPFVDHEAERFIEGDALLQIVNGEAGHDRADLQSSLRCRHNNLLVVGSFACYRAVVRI